MRGGKSISSDLYFIRIRKLDEQFRSAMSMGGGGGGGGGGQGGMQVDALSQQQREIISATHNIVRDKKAMTPQKLRESLVVVGLSQTKLREQVEGLVGRMNSRLVEPDPAFQKIAELLPKAAEEMRAAEAKLQAQAADARDAAGESRASTAAEGRRRVREAGEPAARGRRRWRGRRRRIGFRRSRGPVQAGYGQARQPVRNGAERAAAAGRSAG